ncbi:TPA: hypothetical protein ACGO1T_000529 [Streptococcus suis]
MSEELGVNPAHEISENTPSENKESLNVEGQAVNITDSNSKKVTAFREIYPLFLAQIDDYELASLNSEEEANLYVEKYLLNGLPSVQDAFNDITNIDLENKCFSYKLSFVEMALIAKAMKLEWVREKRYSLDLMRKSIGDRDFKAVQGTDYLKQLGIMEKELRYELRDEIIKHSYSKPEYWGVFR